MSPSASGDTQARDMLLRWQGYLRAYNQHEYNLSAYNPPSYLFCLLGAMLSDFLPNEED
jgi:hypothetical protein